MSSDVIQWKKRPDVCKHRQESDFPAFSPPSFFPLFLLLWASMSGVSLALPLLHFPNRQTTDEPRVQACHFHQNTSDPSICTHTHTHRRWATRTLTFKVTAGGRRKTFLGFTADQFQTNLQHFHLISTSPTKRMNPASLEPPKKSLGSTQKKSNKVWLQSFHQWFTSLIKSKEKESVDIHILNPRLRYSREFPQKRASYFPGPVCSFSGEVYPSEWSLACSLTRVLCLSCHCAALSLECRSAGKAKRSCWALPTKRPFQDQTARPDDISAKNPPTSTHTLQTRSASAEQHYLLWERVTGICLCLSVS